MELEDDPIPESHTRLFRMLPEFREKHLAESARLATELCADPENADLLNQWEKNRTFLRNSYISEGFMHLANAHYAFTQARFAPGHSIANGVATILTALMDVVRANDLEKIKVQDGPLQWARRHSPLARYLSPASPRAAAARALLSYISRTMDKLDRNYEMLRPAIPELVSITFDTLSTIGLYADLVPRHLVPQLEETGNASAKQLLRDKIHANLTSLAGKKYNDRRIMRSVLKAMGWEERVVGAIMKSIGDDPVLQEKRAQKECLEWVAAQPRLTDHYPLCEAGEELPNPLA